MKPRYLLIVLTVLLAQPRSSASAAPPEPASEDTKRACVEASTEGQVQRDEGHLLEARAQLLMCARDVCPTIVRKSCSGWLEQLEPRIPRVVVRILDAAEGDVVDSVVTIDGAAITLDGRPILLDPGLHTIAASVPGGGRAERKVLLAEHESTRLITLEIPGQAPPPSASEPALLPSASAPRETAPTPTKRGFSKVPLGALILAGGGALTLGAFGYLAARADAEHDETARECGRPCLNDKPRVDYVFRFARGADAALGIGVTALVAAGVWTVWSLRSSERPAPKALLSLAPVQLGAIAALSGRY